MVETAQNEATTSAVNVEVSTKHQVTWAASDTEKALKTILAFAKTFAGSYKFKSLIASISIWQHNIVVSVLARLLLGWVTACGQVNCLGM